MKILIIDDNENNRLLIKSIFNIQKNKPEVITAVDGEEGLVKARKELPDIILLDILMPGIDGFEVCRILKSEEKTKRIPIVMVTALGSKTEDRIKSLNLGADAIIAKPFDRNELVSQVNVLIRIRESEETLRKQNEIQRLLLKEQIESYEKSEGRYLQISEYALELFWEIDEEGIITFISPVIEKILGLKSEEITGKISFIDLFSSGCNESPDVVQYISLKKSFREVEVKLYDRNQNEVWLVFNGFPTYSTNVYSGFRGAATNITERKKMEIELKASIKKNKEYQMRLRKLNIRMNAIKENERRRNAQYIHDSIGQMLSIASINLSSLLVKDISDEYKKTINDSVTFLNEAIENSRSLTMDLSPPILYEAGLIPAIIWKLEDIKSKHNLDFYYNFTVTELKIDTRTSVELFRILSELIINIVKHAEASLVKVVIKEVEGRALFIIIDDGKGIGEGGEYHINEGKGFGLFSINEQIDAMGGKLLISSNPMKGTKIEFEIPISVSNGN